ncbi:calcium-activated chloride channel-domain-containing protein [Boeremia exigua]|uniref:calcium-activated chloride channel-domain-containing protein n=1 Tax=Boeremia exigua TaxID=749465 RepID=UPI001E8EC324|nr:calcium-activated chloride channel-domain-containing protein [Boeremia exigua]KAH6639056.1 calcium-activated chloride channel-domain-containing protein [Boeremia exigua]
MKLRRADTTIGDDQELANVTYNDKYVVVYDFGNVEHETAVTDFTTLIKDLHSAGLNTEVRHGYDQSLLVFVQAPRELLGNTVYKSRVKDWLYGITKQHPGGTASSVVAADFEAEDLLSVFHLVTFGKELGGAGITPGFGQWENVSSVFALHNQPVNNRLLTHLSRRFFLDLKDLDQIRDLWGSKVAFYFAFLQTYFHFLAFPCVAGVVAWAVLPQYSLLFALMIGVWCTVFLEHWKIKQQDLAIRWDVRGVGNLKANRPQFQHESTLLDAAGRVIHYFPRWKRIARQLLVVPFVLVSTLFLGALITIVFAIETFISEAYDGPYKFYLEYLPTVLLGVFLPYATSFLEDIADKLTEYENHRTADHHEMSLTQKIFVLNSITNYLPIFITAFLYVPFGSRVIPMLQYCIDTVLGSKERGAINFKADPDRLRNEVIALTLTGQVSGAIEELALPWFKTQFKQWWRDRQETKVHQRGSSVQHFAPDDPGEAKFLRRARKQALRSGYNVQDDVAEMVIQFGYLALFSPVWPLVPIGFFINNWFELRSDFLKISVEYQRPAPVRSDGLGPWISSLEALTWLGSLSSAAIVHLFGSQKFIEERLGWGLWASLPITILISEHIFMGFRAGVRFALAKLGSEQIRKERAEEYVKRKRILDELEANAEKPSTLGVAEIQRRKSVRINAADIFWTRQVDAGASRDAGMSIIKTAKAAQEDRLITGRGRKTD